MATFTEKACLIELMQMAIARIARVASVYYDSVDIKKFIN